MEEVLSDAGYEIDAAATEAGARELLQRRSYSLVIADAKLPDGTGLAVADDARDKGTKALILTGYAFTLPRDASHDYDILIKPLRPPELLDAVARRLDAAQARD